MTHTVIVGATSAIAKAFAREWAQFSPSHFSLVGRDATALHNIGTDLTVRSPGTTYSVHIGNLLSPVEVEKMMAEICEPDIPQTVLIAQGSLPSQQLCQEDLQLLEKTVEVNAMSQAFFAEAAAHFMQGHVGTIALVGSVAGDRGRKSNYAYGASKAFIDAFARGLQHRFYGSPLNVLLIKPGPVDTPMTAQLSPKPSGLATPQQVARDISRAIIRKKKTLYTPGKWALIMFIVRSLPGFIFNKTNL